MGENTKKMVRPPAFHKVYTQMSIKSACVVWWKIKIIYSLTPSFRFFCKELIIFLSLFDGFMDVIFLPENHLIVERKLNEH